MQGRSPFPEGDEDNDTSDSDDERLPHYISHQDQWKESLASYPSLDEDFEHLGVLFSQYRTFREWSSGKKQAWWKRLGTKRKRQVEDRDAEEEKQDHTESEESDF